MMNNYFTTWMLVSSACLAVGCGSSDADTIDPTDVRFGDTALVVVVNPIVNDANSRTVPTPGLIRSDVRLTTDDGVTATTDDDGVAVLAPLTAGERTVTVSGSGVGGSFTVTMDEGQLREIAIATEGTNAEVMVNVPYRSERITELTPDMSISEVNEALAVSDTVVFFRGGLYSGDIDFSGSQVTLFGEGILGGQVTLEGNVTVSGSDSRIRGAYIMGNLTVPASGVGISFSRVDGDTSAEGSDTTLLGNALCGGVSITGSGSLAIDNVGAPPVGQCP